MQPFYVSRDAPEQSVATQKDSFLGNYSFHPPPPPPNISLSVCDVFRYSYLPSLINYTSSCTSMKRVCKKWIQFFQLEFERTSFPRYTARFATLLFCSIMFVCLCHCYRILWSTEIWCRSESRFRRISDERNDEYARASHSQSRWWSLQTGNISLYLLLTAFNWTFSNSKGFYSHPQVVVYVLHKMKKWKWKKWENEIMGKKHYTTSYTSICYWRLVNEPFMVSSPSLTHRFLMTSSRCSDRPYRQVDFNFLDSSLPSPYTAFSQSLSVNSFRFVSHFPMDHVTRNALAARKNEA